MAMAPAVPDEIQALSAVEVYSVLLMNYSQLEAKNHNFVESLLDSGAKRQEWTVSQLSWARYYVYRLANLHATANLHGGSTTVDLADGTTSFAGVFDLIQKAKDNGLKHPALILKLPTAGSLKVRLGVPKNPKYADRLLLTDGGKWPNSKWYGAIDKHGKWECPSKVPSAVREEIADTLYQLASDPAGTAKVQGKLTGHCCFCGTGLTDPHSVAAGFGPYCADKYGLKAQWHTAVKKAAALDAAADAKAEAAAS